MDKTIRNQWLDNRGARIQVAHILDSQVGVEGLSIRRLRFQLKGAVRLDPMCGHVITILCGEGWLTLGRDKYRVSAGVHLFIPLHQMAALHMTAGAELIHVFAPEQQVRGTQPIIRDEVFLRGAATNGRSLRWILTPQYLSRRVFLHHDRTLLSKNGDPISWFHTTMFDVTGLSHNSDGMPVFKMSYNYRTEVNVCYDVVGSARVRYAVHPYDKDRWSPWHRLTNDTTYCLNETAHGADVEFVGATAVSPLRNRHEVSIQGGHVSLCCLFDPAPTGMERHQPGEYSSYGSLADVLNSSEHSAFVDEMRFHDHVLDTLSVVKAKGTLRDAYSSVVWNRYSEGLEAQHAVEQSLVDHLLDVDDSRLQVLTPWLVQAQRGQRAFAS